MKTVFKVGDFLYQVLIDWSTFLFEVEKIKVINIEFKGRHPTLHFSSNYRDFHIFANELNPISSGHSLDNEFIENMVFTTREKAYDYFADYLERVISIIQKELKHEWINVVLDKPMQLSKVT